MESDFYFFLKTWQLRVWQVITLSYLAKSDQILPHLLIYWYIFGLPQLWHILRFQLRYYSKSMAVDIDQGGSLDDTSF